MTFPHDFAGKFLGGVLRLPKLHLQFYSYDSVTFTLCNKLTFFIVNQNKDSVPIFVQHFHIYFLMLFFTATTCKVRKVTYERSVSIWLLSPVVWPAQHDRVVFETSKSCPLNSTHTNQRFVQQQFTQLPVIQTLWFLYTKLAEHLNA